MLCCWPCVTAGRLGRRAQLEFISGLLRKEGETKWAPLFPPSRSSPWDSHAGRLLSGCLGTRLLLASLQTEPRSYKTSLPHCFSFVRPVPFAICSPQLPPAVRTEDDSKPASSATKSNAALHVSVPNAKRRLSLSRLLKEATRLRMYRGVLFFSFAAKNHSDTQVFFYLWIIFYFISSCYTLIWDLKMDWGLFDKNAGENTFLREGIVYPQKVSLSGMASAVVPKCIPIRFSCTLQLAALCPLHAGHEDVPAAELVSKRCCCWCF